MKALRDKVSMNELWKSAEVFLMILLMTQSWSRVQLRGLLKGVCIKIARILPISAAHQNCAKPSYINTFRNSPKLVEIGLVRLLTGGLQVRVLPEEPFIFLGLRHLLLPRTLPLCPFPCPL